MPVLSEARVIADLLLCKRCVSRHAAETAPSASTAVSTDSTTSTSQSNPPIATRPSSVSPTTGEAWKLTHLQRRRGPHRRDVVLHRVLHLLEGAHLDLAHALPAEAEFLGQLRKRDLFLGEPARLEDAPLALVEHGERIGQRLAAVIELLARGPAPVPGSGRRSHPGPATPRTPLVA